VNLLFYADVGMPDSNDFLQADLMKRRLYFVFFRCTAICRWSGLLFVAGGNRNVCNLRMAPKAAFNLLAIFAGWM
jgi:hypothetical protein